MIIFLIAILLVFLFIFCCVITVKQHTMQIIEVFGRFYNAKHAGLRCKIPYPIGIIAGTVDLRIMELVKVISVKALDNAFVEVPVKVQYRVIPEKIKEAYYELQNPSAQMLSYIVNVVRATASAMPMNDLFQSKNAIEDSVKKTLNERFSNYGYAIVNVLVDDPQPSQEVRTAFDKVVASEREKEAAVNQAEAYRIRKVEEARAEAESIMLKSRAYVESRMQIISLAKQEMDASDTAVLNLIAGIDYRDALRDIARDGSLIVVPHGFSDYNSAVLTSEILKKSKS